MLDLLHLGECADHLVVEAAEGVDEFVIRAALLDADHDLVAFLPALDVFVDKLGRVLKVRRHQHGGISVGLQHSVIRAVELAEVFRIEDRLQMLLVGSAECPDAVPRVIRGVIVHKKDLPVIFLQAWLCLELLSDSLRDRSHVILLVIAGDHNADFFSFHTCSVFPL